MEVRNAIKQDIPAIMKMDGDFQIAQYYRKKNMLCLVAEDDRGVHGYVLAERDALEYSILHIFVCIPSRKRGIGSRLIKGIEGRIGEDVSIEVAADREGNCYPFFLSVGFRPIADMKVVGDSWVMMRKGWRFSWPPSLKYRGISLGE